MEADVIILGAGLTGLSAAHHCKSKGLKVVVIEKENHVGGRINTTVKDGFILDHGFQVILSSYEELIRLGFLERLQAQPFWSGARIRTQDGVFDVFNPLQKFFSALQSLDKNFYKISDLLPLLKLWMGLSDRPPEKLGISTEQYLKSQGFSEQIIKTFLRPFFSGVFLERTLNSDAGLFLFLLRKFAYGSAVLPKDGAAMLPRLLAEPLADCLQLNQKVERYDGHGVQLQDGRILRAKNVIMTFGSCQSWNQTATLYFSAAKAPYSEPLLTITSDDSCPINNVQVLTNVQPGYAPRGQALISVSVLEPFCSPDEQELKIQTIRELRKWYGESVESWELVGLFRIPQALPQAPLFGKGYEIRSDGVILAGDAFSYGSQNGALYSGRMAAEQVVS